MRRRVVTLSVLFLLVGALDALAARSARIEPRTMAAITQRAAPGTPLQIEGFDLAGRLVDLDLRAFDVWAADAVIRVYGEDGGFEEVAPDRRIYWGGQIIGDETSMVLFSVGKNEIRGLVIADDVKHVVRSYPRSSGEPIAAYVEDVEVESNLAIEERRWKCDIDRLDMSDLVRPDGKFPISVRNDRAELATSTARYQLGIYFETDYELYQLFGASTSALSSWLADLIAASSVIYERDLATILLLSGATIHSTMADPFSDSTDTGVLLDELGDLWHNDGTRAATSRSAVMMMSGRDAGGGLAWLGTICEADILNGEHWAGAYGVSANITNTPIPDPNGSPSPSDYWALIVFTHELGHIVNSPHTHCIQLTPADQSTWGRTFVDECDASEGGCFTGTPMVPPEKGTIMSYCDLLSGGAANVRYLFGKSGEASNVVITPDATYNSTTTIRGRLAERSPNPSAITAPSQLAAGASGVASIDPLGGVVYEWTVTNGTIDSGQGTNAINFTATSDPVTVKVVVVNSGAIACAATDSVTIAVTSSVSVPGDMDGDGRADIAWRAQESGTNAVWLMNGTTLQTGALLPSVGSELSMDGFGDLNADGKTDIVWRNTTTGENAVWLMNGTTILSGVYLPSVADTSLRIEGVGDFNGDGKPDILWRNIQTGEPAIWIMDGTSVSSGAVLPAITTDMDIQAIGDLNSDTFDDIVWRNPSTGENAVWFMSGTTIALGAALPSVSGISFNIVGAGDFDADGKDDLFWRDSSTGTNAVWLMNSYAIKAGAELPSIATPMYVGAIGDFNGDGKADLAWRNNGTGTNAMWLMDGTSILTGAFLPEVSDVGMNIEGPW